MVKFTATLRDQSGFEHVYEYEVEEELADNEVFMWEDGNYACDCNRSIFLYSLNYDNALPCSNGKITVISLKQDGVEVYKESYNARAPETITSSPAD